MKFIGRKKELKDILKRFNSNRFEALFVYGRRRVGKSELIKEAIKRSGIRAITYVCRESVFQSNLEGLSYAITSAFGEDYLSFTALEPLLSYVFQKSSNEKIILFIDEYPFLRSGQGGAVDSEFQIAIDRFQNSSMLKLIICGSYIDMMKQIIEADRPLYGRFTYQLHLKPFDYYEAAAFFPDCTHEEQFEYYACFGGIPSFLKEISTEDGLAGNIQTLLIPSGSALENEVQLQLKSELGKVESLNTLLEAIGTGCHSYKDLNARYSGESHSGALYPLNKLVEMELVEKTAPVNAPDNRKLISYYISDNMLDFFYSFLYRRISERSIMNPETFYKQFVEEKLRTDFLPRKFEKAAKEYLIRKNRAGGIDPPLTAIGRYVYHDKKSGENGEFDVCARSGAEWICYECKYRSKKLDLSLIHHEKAQIGELGLKFDQFGFFSKKGFEEDVYEDRDILISLDQMYE